MDKKTNSKYLNIITCAYFVVVAIAIFTVIFASAVSKKHVSHSGDYTDFGEGWTTTEGEETDLKSFEQSGAIVKTIPVLDSDRTLSFRVRSMNIQVLVDSETVYETDSYAEPIFGKTPGFYYVRIPLKASDSGRQIEIRPVFTYGDNSGKIVDMYIGNSADIAIDSMRSTISGFVVSVLMTFLGTLLVVVYVVLCRRKLVPREMVYLGLFSMCVGLYLMMNSGFLNILIFRENLVHMVEEIWLMLITVPLICFLDCKYTGKNNKPVVIALTTYCFAVFFFSYTTHWLNWKDYHELMILNHIGFVATIIYFTYCVIRAIRSGSNEGKKGYLVGPVFIFAGVILDMVNWKFGYVANSSVFTRIGVLLFLVTEGIQIVEKMIIQYQSGIKSQIVSRLAYHDGLTDMLNRTSFMEEHEKMEKNRSLGLVAMFDVNNLKKVNDGFGHAKGDELIMTAADAIREAFGDLGKCFRIGGDEFVLLADKNCSEEKFIACKDKFSSLIAVMETGRDYPISVACGYAVWNDRKYHDFDEFLNDADDRMYENKREMKASKAYDAQN
ncbi:MAG: diguanylate cyclase domain-containing protein [Butyrivibrio sp.]